MARQSSGDGEKTQVVVRIDKAVVKRVDHIGVEWETFRGETIERLLRMAADQADREGASDRLTVRKEGRSGPALPADAPPHGSEAGWWRG